jgi:endonuclease YncB( thermonuclease family)
VYRDHMNCLIRLVVLVGCGVATVAAQPARAAGCRLEPQGEGRVATVIDVRTFRLEDAREIRLAGIESVATSVATLTALLAGHTVTLHGETDAPDRWGRQVAFVFADGSSTSVQAQLLAQGDAVMSGDVTDKACAGELTAAEAGARRAKRGTWADSDVIKSAERPDDILARVGRFAVVEGKVLSVREAGATFYANFGRRWTQDFAATISRRMMASFEAAGISLKSLQNRNIRVRGFVERRGGPRIELVHVGQIEVIGER